MDRQDGQGGQIVTDRLLLRPPARADVPRIVELCGDLAVSRWLSRVPHPLRPADVEAFLETLGPGPGRVWAIERAGEGLIGIVGIDAEPDGVSLGYWIGRRHWGQGHATEAARAAVGWAFGASSIDGLTSGAFDGNTASLRVQAKLGFRVTGRRRLGCRALGRDLVHIDTRLDRADWRAIA